MLVDWNEGYISVCPTPDLIPVEDKHTYIPTSTWGYIRGDISEQKDLMNLLTTIESGLSPAQIALLVDADERIDEVKADVIGLEQKHNTEISDINSMLNSKVNITDVYTKSEIDSKGYLTEHQSLAGYATENWVYQRGYISAETDPVWSAEKHKYALKTELPNVSGLASESWVKQQGYITEHQSLADYYTKNEVDTAIENVEVDLTGYATEDWVTSQGYITTSNLNDYYTKSEVDTAIENAAFGDVDLTGYATESWVIEQDYATESWVNDNKVDYSKIWTGTQEEWDSLSVDVQNGYILAMIEL